MLRAARLKTVVAVLAAFCLIVSNIMPVYGLSFGDISGYWAKDSILRLASLQIVKGYGATFNPSAGVTRAEFTAMIVNALGLDDQARVVSASPTGYADVTPSHWAAGFIIVAKEIGIISGYPDGTFKPSAMIRRDEITSVLVRALDLTSGNGMKDPLQAFADGKDISDWAVNAVKLAFNYKLISGFPDGMFYPGHNATRGETVVLIERVLEQLGAEFTFYGNVQKVDRVSGLTLDIQGQIESFPLKAGAEVRIEGAPGTINDLKPGNNVNVILDREGYINFIQTVEAVTQTMKQVNLQSFGSTGLENLNPQAIHRPAARTERALIVSGKGLTGQVSRLIESRGGKVAFVNNEIDFISADVTNALFRELKASPLVEQITADRRVKVDALGPLADDTSVTPNEDNPGISLNVTKQAIKAPEFVKLTHSDGKNQVIAIIDTGVDPGHPDLQKTSSDTRKIMDWRDFTGEGDIDTSSIVAPTGKNVKLSIGTYNLGPITSVSGRIRYGYLREVDIIDAKGKNFDINFNGNRNDLFAIIVVDSTKSGLYDTVYIDTNNNNDFSDEKPLHLFSRSAEFASFTGNMGKDQFDFVVTEIDSDGSKINLGFDGNEHGTHVAGIAAANGRIKGVAPGAQLMVLKALDTAGYGDLSTISEAITYAASHGAQIINLSLGFPVSDSDNGSLPVKLLDNLTAKYGVIFVVAAGNDGPGLNTVVVPGNDTAAVSVGAFNTPEMWKTDYGWDVPNENLWFFSSAGPRTDGAVSPSIVAPGSAVSTVPLRDGNQYWLSEGTSMAVPHVAGAIALLMEVVQRNKLNVPPVTIKRALELGAGQIPGYQAAEQGYGALNLTMSWAELLALGHAPSIGVQTLNPYTGQGKGIFFREGIPQKLTLFLKNNSGSMSSLKLAEGPFVKPAQATVNVPSGKTRAIDLNIDIPDKKGLFSTFITGDDSATYGNDFEVLATIVNPYQLSEDNSYSVSIDDSQNAAQYKRYFFNVPAGAESVTAKLMIPKKAGRAMVFLFNPYGQLVSESDFAGVNPDGAAEEVDASGHAPSAGVWEAVVYSSAALSAYSLNRSDYRLSISLGGVKTEELQQENRNVIIGVVPKVLHFGLKNYVSVQVRDRYTKKPYEGFIEINGKIYFSRGGRVILPEDYKGDDASIIVKTVPQSPAFKPWEFDFRLPFTE